MVRGGVWNPDGEKSRSEEDIMAMIALADTNVVELSTRRARRNLRAINEAKHRHPSYVGRMTVAKANPEACRVLQFRS
jgi:hypothetical protein